MGVREGNFYVFLNRYFYVWWGGRFCWFMLQYWAVPRPSRNGEMGRDSLHCTTRAVAGRRRISRKGDAYHGRATRITKARQNSRDNIAVAISWTA